MMRTPLGRVRGLGAARSGTGHFWFLRLTAVANVPLVVFFLATVVANVGAGHEAVSAYLGTPIVAAGMLLLICSGVYHMQLGMQEIIMDYVHGEGLKVAALLGNTFFCIAIAVGCIFAILRLGTGV